MYNVKMHTKPFSEKSTGGFFVSLGHIFEERSFKRMFAGFIVGMLFFSVFLAG